LSWVRVEIRTHARNCLIDITPKIAALIEKAGIEDGAAIVYIPHTTAAVTVNEGADPDVVRDILSFLESKIPKDCGFRHFEGNSDAHIKSSLVGVSQTIPIKGSKLALGVWQKVYFCEFDGPRERGFLVSLVKF